LKDAVPICTDDEVYIQSNIDSRKAKSKFKKFEVLVREIDGEILYGSGNATVHVDLPGCVQYPPDLVLVKNKRGISLKLVLRRRRSGLLLPQGGSL
jgi:hypothetical protein